MKKSALPSFLRWTGRLCPVVSNSAEVSARTLLSGLQTKRTLSLSLDAQKRSLSIVSCVSSRWEIDVFILPIVVICDCTPASVSYLPQVITLRWATIQLCTVIALFIQRSLLWYCRTYIYKTLGRFWVIGIPFSWCYCVEGFLARAAPYFGNPEWFAWVHSCTPYPRISTFWDYVIVVSTFFGIHDWIRYV